MSKSWRPFMWIAFGLAGIATYFAVAVPSKTAPPAGAVMILATASSDGEHSPCG